MKILTLILRLVVSFTFIFSGFVKLVDPLGSSYKFQEYFGSDVLNLGIFDSIRFAIFHFADISRIDVGRDFIAWLFAKIHHLEFARDDPCIFIFNLVFSLL